MSTCVFIRDICPNIISAKNIIFWPICFLINLSSEAQRAHSIFLQESRRIKEVEKLNLTGKSQTQSNVFYTYGGIVVNSSVDAYVHHWYSDGGYHTKYYPISNMFSEGSANVNNVFVSAHSTGQLTFYLPTKVYVEYLRIYPYCGGGHRRYVISSAYYL